MDFARCVRCHHNERKGRRDSKREGFNPPLLVLSWKKTALNQGMWEVSRNWEHPLADI